MARKARAALLVAALLSWAPFVPASAETFADLTVEAPDFDLQAIAHGSFATSLFEVPGDIDNDGIDDLLLKGGDEWGYAPGSPTGLAGTDRQVSVNAFPCWYEEMYCPNYGSAAFPPGVDGKPAGVSADGVPGADWLDLRFPSCPDTEWPDCPNGFFNIRYGNATTRQGYIAAELRNATQSPPQAFLLPAGPQEGGAVLLIQRMFPRDRGNGTPARTEFRLQAIVDGRLFGQNLSWTVQEPTPFSEVPRNPTFLAAPDFDGDRFPDIVVWTPGGQGPGSPSPGHVFIYNGSADGYRPNSPFQVAVEGPSPLIADFDGDYHPDIGWYQTTNVEANGAPGKAHIDLNMLLWSEGAQAFSLEEYLRLEGPAIFMTQPPVRLQAGYIDDDAAADFVAVKYDTTSSDAAHLLIDVYLGMHVCRLCDWAPRPDPDFSTEIRFNGTDIFATDGAPRVNVQGDFDGDQRHDVVVGFYGTDAPRSQHEGSGFVAVLYARTIFARVYHISLDADAGRLVFPMYRDYTVTADADGVGDPGDVELEFTGLAGEPTLTVNTSTLEVSSSNLSWLVPAGLASIETVTCIRAPCPGTFRVSFAFNWSFPRNVFFGLSLRHAGAVALDDIAFAPNAGVLMTETKIIGNLSAESDGRALASGSWVRGGAGVNLTSDLSVVFRGSYDVHPAELITWRLTSLSNATVYEGGFPASVNAPNATNREWIAGAEFSGLPAVAGRPFYKYQLAVDGGMPEFGDHLPLEGEWSASWPVLVAAQIFDNESGVDPARIEYSYIANGNLVTLPPGPGPSYSAWTKAEFSPGQTAGEVAATALVDFPNGHISNWIRWRTWDLAGNGPVVSTGWRVEVDTENLRFHDPSPAATEWWANTTGHPGIWISAGASGVNSSTVEFRFSAAGPFAFGAWMDWCPGGLIDPPGTMQFCGVLIRKDPDGSLNASQGTGFGVWGGVNYSEGDVNWIQWRASNLASPELRYSDPFQIRVDSRAPQIVGLEYYGPDPLRLGPVPLRVWAREGNSDNVSQRGLDLTPGAAFYRVKAPGQTEFSNPRPLLLEAATASRYYAIFTATLALERGTSTVEVTVSEPGGRSATAEATIHINENPTVTVWSEPGNLTVEQNGTMTLHANAFDPERERLNFSWMPCDPPARPGPQRPLSLNETFVVSSDPRSAVNTSRTEDFRICLTVRDPFDGVFEQEVTVHVVPPAPSAPPPPDPSNGATVAPFGDATLVILLVLAAVIGATATLIGRRRRLPPDNL